MLRATLYLADQNPHRDRSLGITRATRAIADALGGRVALRQVVSRSSVALGAGAVAGTDRLPFRTDHAPGRVAADALHPALARAPADVWFYPKGFAPGPLRPAAPALALIHDTILVHYRRHYPAARSALAYAYWTRQLRATLAGVDRVATVSETARGQILAFCDEAGLAAPPIDVVYAATPFAHVAPAAPAAPAYVLHLASEAPHKRTRWLLEAWRALADAGRDLPALTLLGPLDDEAAALAARLPGVRRSRRVTDAELATLFRDALAVVVPSEIEGFGLPVLEAYASGTPVCVTAGTALEEVLGVGTDRGVFHLDDPATLGDALDEVAALTVADVGRIQARLRSAFSPDKLGDRVEGALRAAAA